MAVATLVVLANLTAPILENANWTGTDCLPIYMPASNGEPPYMRSGSCFWGQSVQQEYLGSELPLRNAKKVAFRAELLAWSGWRSRGPHVFLEYADWGYMFDMYQGRALATSRSVRDAQTADFYLSSSSPDMVHDEYYTFEVLIDLEQDLVSGSIERQSTGTRWSWSDMSLFREYGSGAQWDGRVHFRMDSIGTPGHRARGVEITVYTDGEDGPTLSSACTHDQFLFVLPAGVSGDYAIEGSERIYACRLRGEAPTRYFNFSHGECNTTSRVEGDHIVDVARAVFQVPPGTVVFNGDSGPAPLELHCRRPRFANGSVGVQPEFTTPTAAPSTFTATPENHGVSFELRAGAECEQKVALGEGFPADEEVMCFMASSARSGEALSFVDCMAVPEQEEQYKANILTNTCADEPFNVTAKQTEDYTAILVPTFRIAGFGSYRVTCAFERCLGGSCRTCDASRLLQDAEGFLNSTDSSQATTAAIEVPPGIHVKTLPGRAPDVVLMSKQPEDEDALVPVAPDAADAACCFHLSIHLGGPVVAMFAAQSVAEEEAGPDVLETALASVLHHARVRLESVKGVSTPATGVVRRRLRRLTGVPELEAMEASFIVTVVGDGNVELLAEEVQEVELQQNFTQALAKTWPIPPETIIEFGQPTLLLNTSATSTALSMTTSFSATALATTESEVDAGRVSPVSCAQSLMTYLFPFMLFKLLGLLL